MSSGRLRGRTSWTRDRAVVIAMLANVPSAKRTGYHAYLPVLPRGQTSWDREHVEIPAFVNALGAVASRPSAKPAQCAESAQTYETVVRLQDPLVLLITLRWSLQGRVFRGELRRSQDGRHEERA